MKHPQNDYGCVSASDCLSGLLRGYRKWWPKGPSFNNKDQLDINLEGRVGGRLYERYTDGSEFVIGRITAYQPPVKVAFTWRAPSLEADTEVEVRFFADGDGGTRIEL
jgi:uncharacterized protein YndB with AHSA1/START domain